MVPNVSTTFVSKSVYCMPNFLLHGLEGFLNPPNNATRLNVVWDQGGLEVPCSLLFKAMLMETVGSECPLLGLK